MATAELYLSAYNVSNISASELRFEVRIGLQSAIEQGTGQSLSFQVAHHVHRRLHGGVTQRGNQIAGHFQPVAQVGGLDYPARLARALSHLASFVGVCRWARVRRILSDLTRP